MRVPARRTTILAAVAMLVLGSMAACGDPADEAAASAAYARAVEAAEARHEPGALTAALERIHAWLEARAPVAVEVLQPGLTDAEIDAAVRRAGFGDRLPAEVRALYRWRDGSRPGTDVPFVGGWRLLGLEEALAAARGEEARTLFGLPAGSLPLLAFQEEFLYVRCEPRDRKALPALFRLLEDPATYLEHGSLTALFRTWADAEEAGAVVLDEDTATQEPVPDAWERIRAGHGPATILVLPPGTP